ncbi:general secretion pathway protein GspC [Corallococcus sp. H22C18031201]|nr:general secretion pathway protein GspC [Corallococcus sp. H22C18031201]
MRAVTAAFIASAVCVIALTMNVFIEDTLVPTTAGLTQAPMPRHRAASDAPPTLEGARFAALTGLTLQAPPALSGTPPPDTETPSPLPLRLLGTLVAQEPVWSLASVQIRDSARPKSLMVGDSVLEAKVIAIERTRLLLEREGHREVVALGAPQVAPTPARALTQPEGLAPSGSKLGQGIRALSENAYEIPRQELSDALGHLNELAVEARLMPAFQDGQAVGFKVSAIRPDSFYTRLGLQNGDVLRRINGFDLNSPEKLLELYAKLRDSPHLELDVVRGGASVRKVYDVR